MPTIKPFRDLILINPDPKNDKSASGLIIKEAWESPVCSGVIEEIGQDVKTMKKGQHIYYNPYAVLELNLGNSADKREVVLIKEVDVIGIINE